MHVHEAKAGPSHHSEQDNQADDVGSPRRHEETDAGHHRPGDAGDSVRRVGQSILGFFGLVQSGMAPE